MRIMLLSPTREASGYWKDGMKAYVDLLEKQGHVVHYPLRDTPQNDRTGLNICKANLKAIQQADEIHIAWDGKSQGVLFDLGMAFALGKIIKPVVGYFPPLTPHKSFQAMVYTLEAEQQWRRDLRENK